MRRAVRFIRSKATDFGIDPERIGVTGGSAGGHLSLMLGTAGRDGDPKAKDPVDRFSSRVQAVGCFFPPTDFLNYGEKGHVALGTGTLKNFFAPFDFKEFDATTRAFERVSDEEKRKEIGRQISPAVQANDKSAPSLIIHGDADKLVPIQQAEVMVEALKKAGVPAELVVKKGAAHGWPGLDKDLVLIADWFDRHLNKKDSKETNDGK
jgi:dipeptidyl aminopeptidase/acylaminoacyl peptidase